MLEKNSYLLELARYIVLSPIRAGMVRSARDWQWSSYRATAGFVAAPAWLEIHRLLAAFGSKKDKAADAYRAFVAAGKGLPTPRRLLKNQVFLGSEDFIAAHMALIDGDRKLSEIPRSQRRSMPRPLVEYEKRSLTRNEAIYAAYRSGGYNLQEIGNYFGLHYSRVSRIRAEAKKAKNNT